MNQAASSLADGKRLQGAVQNARLLDKRKQEPGGLLQGDFPLGDGKGLAGR